MNEVLTKAEQQVLDALLPKHKGLLEDMIARHGAKETARRIGMGCFCASFRQKLLKILLIRWSQVQKYLLGDL